MKFKNRLTATFPKLIISFALTVIISTVSLGLIFNYYYTHNFNSKVEQVNLKMLEHLSEMINEKVYKTLDKVYADITVFNSNEFSYLYDNNIHANASKVYAAHMKLQDIVEANSYLIDSICLYFKKWDSAIIYPGGVRYHNSTTNIMNSKQYTILNRFMNSDKKTLWTETYVYEENPYFMQVGKKICSAAFSYPINLPANVSKGCIIINIKEEAIHNIIRQSYPTTAGFIFITDMESNIISNSSFETNTSDLVSKDLLTYIIKSGNNYSNFLGKVNGVQSIVSYKTLYGKNWSIVNVTPVDQFYKETIIIGRTLFLICVIVLIIGLLLANVFSVKLYNPVKLMIKNVQNVLEKPQVKLCKKINEYELVNNIINDFSHKINHLQNTLQVNRPVLKHNIILELFDSKFDNYEELQNRLFLIGIDSKLPYYSVMIYELDKDVLDNLNTKNNQFIKYNIIEYIESLSTKNFICLAALTNNYRICILLNYEKLDTRKLFEFTKQVIEYASVQFKISSILYVEEPTDSFENLCLSIKAVKVLLKYSYFLPNNDIITRNIVEKRISSKEKISEAYLECFIKALKSRQIDAIMQAVENVVNVVMLGDYSAECCKQLLHQIVLAVTTYTSEEKIESYKDKERILNEKFASIKNITVFKDWILQICYDLIKSHTPTTVVNKTVALIDATCQFIENNLDAPLSLDMVSEKFSVNPSYLSKAFKDEKEESFTNYINRLRLEKAKELILSSNMKIDDVALKVGFNNTNYFIKKFREMYGTTPKLYKLNTIT